MKNSILNRVLLLIFLAFCAFLFVQNLSAQFQKHSKLVLSKDSIIIQNFYEFPKDIDGCSSSFSKSEKTLNQNNYLFVSSYDGFGYIKIAGKMIRLKLISTNRKTDEFFGNTIKEIYSDGHFKVVINCKYKKQIDGEVWIYSGTMHVIKGSKDQTILKIIGETG